MVRNEAETLQHEAGVSITRHLGRGSLDTPGVTCSSGAHLSQSTGRRRAEAQGCGGPSSLSQAVVVEATMDILSAQGLGGSPDCPSPCLGPVTVVPLAALGHLCVSALPSPHVTP